MRMRHALVFAALLALAGESRATVSNQISVQGVLRDAMGHLQSMQIAVTVKLFTQQTGGDPIASFGPTQVLATNGLFTEVITLDGSTVSAMASSPSVWMEITAGNDTFPRQPVTADMFALLCGQADTATTAVNAQNAQNAQTAQTAATASNAQNLGGVPASGYQRVLMTADCGVGRVIRAIAADGTVTCSSLPAGTVTSVGATAPLSSSGGAAPTISLSGEVPVGNGGNRFGGGYQTYAGGQVACAQQTSVTCYLTNPFTGGCSCPSGFARTAIGENFIQNLNITNCTYVCYR